MGDHPRLKLSGSGFWLTTFFNILTNLNLTGMKTIYKVFRADLLKRSTCGKTASDSNQSSRQRLPRPAAGFSKSPYPTGE
jgi:hypothetical protein